ncbi:hypothetical protein C1H57_13010 [Clostridium sp. 2-1]|uniref:MFS transporter n=1 Tax=Clostridium TaxID=1485 RepID=UPI000CDAAD99|nr:MULTISPECIES: MFS transporter [Clostridium]MBN7573349.1 hypothetical protein [Clostridium beijerinckii]MBN7578687.1 hypothetical protein [Clostridium beijerinckii]MBO0519277.1 hypothetical protein [Clostridium beijerinckii]POO90873.1 hypothetical protein C1H57_13010 [Clostridium sp. 2-1]
MDRETALESIKTPFKRLIAGILIIEGSQFIALMAPLMIILVFKVMEIDPEYYTVSFGIITGFGALVAAFANTIGGALSARTSLKFGRRRTWILIGSVLGSASLMGIALSTNVWMIGMFWCAANLFFNFGTSSATALVPDQVDESPRGRTSGLIGLIVLFSGIMGMLIMNIMGQTPLILRFTVLAVISIITALVGVALIKEGKVVYSYNDGISSSRLCDWRDTFG